MPQNDTLGEIKGLPAGATVEPIVASNGTIRGLPAGAVVEPISKAAEKTDLSRAAKPFSAADEKQYTRPVAGLPQGATVEHIDPAETIYKQTIAEGQSPERAQLRVNEYNYAIKQGLNPERAQQFANSLQWNDTTPQTMTPEQIKAVADNVRAMSPEDREKQFIYGDPDEFAKGYAEARQRGMSDADAVEYGSSNSAQRAMMRAGQWAAPKWTNLKAGILHALGARDDKGHLTTQQAAEAPLAASLLGRNQQDLNFQTYKEASWVDKHFGKIAGSIDAHLANLVNGLTTPEMAAIEIASFGTAGVEGALPEVADTATTAAKATRFAQRTIRTTSQLAHAGFTAQMAAGSAESFGTAASEAKKGDYSEAIAYTIDGLVNGWMASTGVRSLEAHAEVREALDDTTRKVYPDKTFTQLSDKQQALMVQRLIDDDPKFKNAADASAKQLQKNAKRLQQRYSEAVNQTWNPNAAQRVLTDLHAERAETARKEQVQKVLDTIKAQVQKRTDEIRAQEDERQAAISEGREERKKAAVEDREQVQQTAAEIAKGREETYANRQALGEIPN